MIQGVAVWTCLPKTAWPPTYVREQERKTERQRREREGGRGVGGSVFLFLPSRRPSGLRKTSPNSNSLDHRTLWLVNKFFDSMTFICLKKNNAILKSEAKRS